MWLMVMSFEMFYLGFGQAIAAVSPNELLASLLVPIFFTFIVSFCGVVVPYAALPSFWKGKPPKHLHFWHCLRIR
jgi:ATP-binding cassette subfamily G (WHITE) protein 2 (SNQ2)